MLSLPTPTQQRPPRPGLARLNPLLGLATLLGGLLTTSAWGQAPASADAPAAASPAPERPKTCLVLSGGGARGFTHVGVLKALEKLRVPIDCVVGTSMGAIVGGLYASGLSPTEIEKAFLATDWSDLGNDKPSRTQLSLTRRSDDYTYPLGVEVGIKSDGALLPSGVVSGGRFELLLQRLTAHVPESISFDRLPLPFRSVATDLESGDQVVLDHGNLYEAIRASMSVPGLFAPIELEGKLLADGGLVKNLPIDVARAMGAQRIIAVNIGTPLTPRDQLRSLVAVSQQMINILTEQNVTAQKALLGPQDLIISPDLGKLSFLDFSRAAEAISLGVKATTPHQAELRAMGLSETAWAVHLSVRPPVARETVPVQFVDILPTQHVPTQAIREAARLAPGQTADAQTLRDAVARVQETGDFERVSLRAVERDGQYGLLVDAREKHWGPDYLRFGMDASLDLGGEGNFTLRVGHLRTWLNSAGAEWRNDLSVGSTNQIRTELFQPLWLGSRLFATAAASVSTSQHPFFNNGIKLSNAGVRESEVRAELGSSIGRQGELRLGLVRHLTAAHLAYLQVDSRTQNATPEQLNVHLVRTSLTSRLLWDSLDNVYLPRSGQRLEVNTLVNLLGDDGRYERAEVNWSGALTLGDHTFWPALRLGTTHSPNGTTVPSFEMGGFLSLSGTTPSEISGNRMGLMRLAYTNRLLNIDLFGRRLVAGGSLEWGNAWDSRPAAGYTRDLLQAASLFAAAETPLGPLYLALGHTWGKGTALYLFLGRP